MTSFSRRAFLRTSGALSAGALTSGLWANSAAALDRTMRGSAIHRVPFTDDPNIRALSMRALDAARAAGAIYADVRLMRTDRRSVSVTAIVNFSFDESLTIGVRALVGGYWGFACSPIWSADEAVRLGREAVGQARVATAGKSRVVELAPTPVVTGHWEMPVGTDPTTVTFEEYADTTMGWKEELGFFVDPGLLKTEQAFASTDGSYITQTRYLATTAMEVSELAYGHVTPISNAAAGWEHFRDYKYREARRVIDEQKAWAKKLPLKAPPIGRFSAVFAQRAAASLLSSTIGHAVELDRIMGFDANNAGTSYLNDPLTLLGTHQLASRHVSIAADRTADRGCATTRWDDEGVAPEPFTIAQDGVLTDCLTTRESASWIAPWYAKSQQPVRSRGCAGASSALNPITTFLPNLTLRPSATPASTEELCKQLPSAEPGYLIVDAVGLQMDQQYLSGLGSPGMYEVRNGKIVASIQAGAGFLFRSPELWKNVTAVGDATTASTYGLVYYMTGGTRVMRWFGASAHHSVTAVPMLVKDITFVDPSRRVS